MFNPASSSVQFTGDIEMIIKAETVRKPYEGIELPDFRHEVRTMGGRKCDVYTGAYHVGGIIQIERPRSQNGAIGSIAKVYVGGNSKPSSVIITSSDQTIGEIYKTFIRELRKS